MYDTVIFSMLVLSSFYMPKNKERCEMANLQTLQMCLTENVAFVVQLEEKTKTIVAVEKKANELEEQNKKILAQLQDTLTKYSDALLASEKFEKDLEIKKKENNGLKDQLFYQWCEYTSGIFAFLLLFGGYWCYTHYYSTPVKRHNKEEVRVTQEKVETKECATQLCGIGQHSNGVHCHLRDCHSSHFGGSNTFDGNFRDGDSDRTHQCLDDCHPNNFGGSRTFNGDSNGGGNKCSR